MTTLSPPATALGQAIQQIVPAQRVGAVSQSTNSSAIAVAQAATAPAPTATLSAFARSIPNGQSSTLMWSSTNARTCSGTGFSASGLSGSLTITPTATATYGITCTGSGGSASQSVIVAVTPAPKLAVGMTVQTAGSVAMHSSPSMSAPLVGAAPPGWKGGIIGGPAGADGSTWWEVSYKDGLARWAVQEDLMQASAQASQAAPTVTPSAAPQLAMGMTIKATDTVYARPTPSPNATLIGHETPGNQGVVIGGPVSAGGIRFTFWKVAFYDDLTGWVYQGGLAAASPTAPTLSFRASPGGIPPGASSTLSWSSTNATSCSGVGFSPSGVSGSLSVSPTVTTTYNITCTGSGGSTTRRASVIVNAPPGFSWTKSLPVLFKEPGIVRFGGTETRALVYMNGSLYAGIGDSEDPDDNTPPTIDTKILRLDSSTSSWVEDQNFIAEATNTDGTSKFWAPAAMASAHFDKDLNNNPITPVDVLMAGFWILNTGGDQVAQKTVTSGSIGAQGAWTIQNLIPAGSGHGQTRSFTSYTDSVTHQEMVFAGSDPQGIYSGAFNSSTNTIQWGANPEAGTPALMQEDNGNARVMSFAECEGKLYATIYDNVVVRTDDKNPSWNVLYHYDGPALLPASSGFRGLTCVHNINGPGHMLIAGLEGPGDVYDIPLDGSPSSIELHTANFAASQLGYNAGYVVTAYNNMTVYPQSGSEGCPDLIIGIGYSPSFLIRHCNGVYGFRTIVDPNIVPLPALLSTRSIVVSQFSGDPVGTLYVGGYDCHGQPAHNTDWIYRGVPSR